MDATQPDVHSVGYDKDEYVVRTKRGFWIPMRYVLIALLFFGNMNIYGMRVNLSIAMVAMVNDSGTDSHQQTSYCKGVQNDSHRTDTAGEFNWDSTTQGIILGAFFYGYLFTNLPGGYLSVYISVKWLIGLSMAFSAVVNLLTPLAANHGSATLIASRVILGLFQGVYVPAGYALLGLWVPPKERSMLFSIYSAGYALGNVVYLFLSGLLASSSIWGGWPSVFYFSGLLGVCWCILWFPIAYDSPSVHPWIDKDERNYIMRSLKWDDTAKQKVSRVPWLAILTSLPVWGILICQAFSEFVMFIFLAETPTYFSNIQGFDLSQSGFLSGLPWLIQPVIGVSVGLFANSMIRRHPLRVGTVRKALTAFGVFAQCTLLIATAYSGCNSKIAVSCFTIGVSFGGVYLSGYYVNKLDIAPNTVSIISGIANILTTVGGMIGPLMVSAITKQGGTVEEWKLVFWIICAMLFVSGLVFALLGSGEHQPWDRELTVSKGERSPVINEGITAPLLDGGASD